MPSPPQGSPPHPVTLAQGLVSVRLEGALQRPVVNIKEAVAIARVLKRSGAMRRWEAGEVIVDVRAGAEAGSR